MKLTFYGAARSTTGSMHLVETDRLRLLLDCGLYQGHRAEAFARNRHLPFDPRTLTTVILSHAHIDHSGNLPTLVKEGFAGEIVCTTATRDLATLMLRDSAHIQEQDAAYLNQKKSRQGLPPIEPLYTSADAERALRHMVGRAYDQPFELNGSGYAVLRDAGHILGSAIVVLELRERGRTLRLGFSGDLGRPHAPILRDPASVGDLDYLILESTYGDREHPSFEQAARAMANVIREAAERGGQVIVPAFAVGRTQEILYFLRLQTQAGEIPSLPIYVDSPLAISATDVFRLHLECFDDEIRQYLLKYGDPFGFSGLHFTRSVEESKAINARAGPAIIISANGMCEAGRILHHLKHTIEDRRNAVLFVGYQAENTLGRRLVDGAKRVRIFGDEFAVHTHIEMVEGFSAHADRSELLEWVAPLKDRVRAVCVVHGEEKSALAFADALRAQGFSNVLVPQRDETIELE